MVATERNLNGQPNPPHTPDAPVSPSTPDSPLSSTANGSHPDSTYPHIPTSADDDPAKSPYAKFSDAEVLQLIMPGEVVTLPRRISITSIVPEDVIVDEDNVKRISKSLKGELGQLSRLSVRARIDEETGEVVYDIIDGFHRHSAMQANGAEFADADVRYGMTDKQVYDARVDATTSKAVASSRQILWAERSWAETKWGQQGIPLQQAAAAAMNDSKRIRYHSDMSLAEVEEMKAAIRAEFANWKVTPQVFYD
ncbi:MAG TPA: hypothetical protein VG935_02240, partial [Patescibacteria group bacterium]|nr:hypothetical protein [Patescibacteria group bacterium]